MIFADYVKKQSAKMDTTPDKIVVSNNSYFKMGEYNSISEIFADKIDFDMSAIKEMVESLEEESLHFRASNKSDFQKPKSNLRLTPRDDQSQNSFEKIIKYMKNEISKIDAVKKHERDSQKVAKLMKDFIHNLKRIELSPRVLDEDLYEDRLTQPLPIPFTTPDLKTVPPISQTSTSSKVAVPIKLAYQYRKHSNSTGKLGTDHEGKMPLSEQESMIKDEENITKDYYEPVPNRLPPQCTFTSKHNSPDLESMPPFYNDKMSDVFTEFVNMKNYKMSHNTSKEDMNTPEQLNMPGEHLPSSPYAEENKGFYKKYMNSYQSSTLVKDKAKKSNSK
jgi:hypothetical protein